MRSTVPLVVAVALWMLPEPLASQDPPFRLEPGERIEIAAPVPGGGLVPATVTHWEPGWVGFRLEDGQEWSRRTYHIDQVRVLREVPVRRRRRVGATWGLFLGASLGGIAGPFASLAVEGEGSPWAAVGVSAAVGAAAGAGVGALIGGAIRRSTWIHFVFGGPTPGAR